MSWFNNVSGVNLDNPDQKKQETRTESPTTSASVFETTGEVSPEDMGLAVGHADNDDSSADRPQIKTNVDILEEMFQCGSALDVILDYCNKNGLVLDNLIQENAKIRDIVEKNDKYKSLLNKNSGPEAFLYSLYTSSDSVSAISQKFADNVSKPLDLSKNNKNRKKIIDAVNALKDKFVKCKTNKERHALIRQLQDITGIKLGDYNQSNTNIIKRAFAVLYSLTMAVLDFDEEKGFIVDGKKITDTNELITEINKKLADKDHYKNTIDKLGCFATLCQKEILEQGKDGDKDLADKIQDKVKEQRKYASILQTQLLSLCVDNDKKAKILEILNPKDMDIYLDINEFISKAEKALKTVAGFDDKQLKDLKTNTKNNYELNRSIRIRQLLKIYNEYKKIEAEFVRLSAKNDLTDDERNKLSDYQKLRDNYKHFIVEKGIKDKDLDELNAQGVIESEDYPTTEQLKELKDSEYGSEFVKRYGKKVAQYDQHKDLISKLKDKKTIIAELAGKTRSEAIQILETRIAKAESPEEKQRYESLLKSYRTLSDKDIERLVKWSNRVSNGDKSFETTRVNELDAIIQSIKKEHQGMSDEELVLCVTDVIKNMYQDEDTEALENIIDYIAVKIRKGELNEEKMEEDITIAFCLQMSEKADDQMRAKALALHQDDEDLWLFAMSTQYAQSVAEALQQMIQENPDAFSDEFKSRIASAMNEFNNGASGSASGSSADASSSSSSAGSSSGTGGSPDNYSYGASDPMNYNGGDSGNVFMRNWFNPDDSIDNPKNKKTTDNNPENQSSVVTNPFVDARETNSPQNQKLEAKKAAAVSGKYQNGEPIPMPELVNMVKEIWSESPSQVDTLTWVAMSGNSNLIKIVISNITGWNKYLSLTPKSVQEVYEKVQEDKNMV